MLGPKLAQKHQQWRRQQPQSSSRTCHLICQDRAAYFLPVQQQQEVDAHDLIGFEVAGGVAAGLYQLCLGDCPELLLVCVGGCKAVAFRILAQLLLHLPADVLASLHDLLGVVLGCRVLSHKLAVAPSLPGAGDIHTHRAAVGRRRVLLCAIHWSRSHSLQVRKDKQERQHLGRAVMTTAMCKLLLDGGPQPSLGRQEKDVETTPTPAATQRAGHAPRPDKPATHLLLQQRVQRRVARGLRLKHGHLARVHSLALCGRLVSLQFVSSARSRTAYVFRLTLKR